MSAPTVERPDLEVRTPPPDEPVTFSALDAAESVEALVVEYAPALANGTPVESVARTIAHAHAHGLRAAHAVEVGAWPSEPNVPGPPEPESLPLDALPSVIRQHVESVAGATQTPPDMAGILAISALSVTVQGKAEVRVRPGWVEPVNTYACPVLPPASRKSPVYRNIFGSLEECEAEAARKEAPDRQAAEDRREVLEKRLDQAKRDAAKGDVPLEAVEAARFELLEAKVRPVTRLNAPEASPEALVRIMAEQAGRIAVLAPEGDPLRIADGRYSGHGDARLDVLKRAWTGRESIRTDRIGRDGEYIRRPALTLAVCLQPSVLETLQNARSLRGEGVYGRILWVAPDPGIGSRLTGPEVPALDADAARRWDGLLRRLLAARPADVDDDDAYVPHVLTLTDDALAVLYEWEAEVERELGVGGRLSGIPDWGGKLVGQTVRLAALLQVAARAGQGDWEPLWEPIGEWAMQGGVRLGRALTAHALRVYGGMMDADPRMSDLRYLLDKLRDLPAGTTESKLRRATQGRASIDGSEDVADLVDELEARGCVRRVPVPHDGGPGRPRSPVMEIHPSLRKGIAKNAETPPEEGSRNFRNANPGVEPDGPDPVDDVLEAEE